MNTDHTTPHYCRHLASSNSGDAAGHGDSTYLATALAFDLRQDGETMAAPDWIQIFPKGPELATVDGRSFKMKDPQAFVDAQNASQAKPILVDYDHLSSYMPEEGGDQTASGWIEELEVRDGEIWARVAWTIRAAKQIADREWRFVSPEFRVHKKTGEIATLDAVALVNRPAFQMTALAREQKRAHANSNGDTPMLKEIAKALGLSEDASEEQILTAIREKDQELETAKAAKLPSTKDYMPRADYDRVLARAEDAEGKLQEAEAQSRKDEVETMIASAVTAGKITPGTKEHYVALAMASDEGFEEIKKLCANLSPIADPSKLDDKETASSGLSDADREMAATLGVSEEDYAKQLAADKGTGRS